MPAVHTTQGSYVFGEDEPFRLESGGTLQPVTVRFAIYGEPNQAKDNVVLICHALSGSARVTDWWPELVGAGPAVFILGLRRPTSDESQLGRGPAARAWPSGGRGCPRLVEPGDRQLAILRSVPLDERLAVQHHQLPVLLAHQLELSGQRGTRHAGSGTATDIGSPQKVRALRCMVVPRRLHHISSALV